MSARKSEDSRSPDPAESPAGKRSGHLRVVKRTFKEFRDDECPRMAAAISYYTLFSLPPLLVLILTITGAFIDPAQVQGRIESEMRTVIGSEGARQVQEIIRIASLSGERSIWATIASIAALLFGATGAFIELQKALNRAWEVEPDPKKGGILRYVTKRLLSLGMAGTIAFLLLVSLLVSAAVSAFGDRIGALLPGGASYAFLQVSQQVLSLAVVVVLFALMFKVLPDAKSRWRDVWLGALVTGVLFVAGKFVLGFYLARSDPGEAFGAAGALALILVWVYYSAMILFFGAEFTQVWAVERGAGIDPRKGAVRLVDDRPTKTARS